jgi:hypothetical protein
MVWGTPESDIAQLSDEDRILLQIMRIHPDYYDLWNRLAEVSDEELERDGTNPIYHVLIHHTVENQVAAGKPSETAETLDRLMRQGKTRHEALHLIMAVAAEEIFEVLTKNRPYDERRYVKKLRRLGKIRKKLKRRQRS